MAEPAPTSSTRALFGPGPFRLFWTARFLDLLAVQIQAVTLAWQVYQIARDAAPPDQLEGEAIKAAALQVGIVGLAQFLPLFALTLNAGAAADRTDRRLIMMVCIGVEAACVILLALLTFAGLHALWPIFTLAAVFGAARAFFNPASTALAPMLVSREMLPRAIAWNSINWQIAMVLGPALGGVLCAFSPALSYEVVAVLYGLSLAFLFAMRADTKPVRQLVSRVALIREGIAYVWREKIVFGAISLDLFAVLLGGATALLPVYARDVLHVGAPGFGILRAAPAVGATGVAAWLAFRPIKRHAGALMFASVAVFGLATVLFAVSKVVALSLVALAVLGAADMISIYVRQTLIQLVTPDPMRGRVAAVSTLFVGASNELGEFESGVVARFVGPVGAALFGGIGALVITGVWAKLFPGLRKADRLA